MTIQMLHPPTPAAMVPLRLHDLVRLDHERRIPDLTLAERLGFSKPHNVRKLIDRNRPELASHGAIVERPSNFLRDGEKPASRGRPGVMYFLNEGQALVVCALTRTPIAAKVRADVIAVYMAHRRGETYASPSARERYALQFLCEQGHVYIPHEPVPLTPGYLYECSRTVLVAPLSREVFDILNEFEVAERSEGDGDVDAEFNGDDEHPLGWAANVGQLELGPNTEDGDSTALERAGAGFVRSGGDDDEDGHDAEATNEDGGNVEDEPQLDHADNEPSLGSPETVKVGRFEGTRGVELSQVGWGNSSTTDREFDVDSEEAGAEDYPFDPELGS